MNTYNLTDPQKELLRTIVKSDDEGELAEKGTVLIMQGDDQYMLWGCNLTLDSLADLDALCDEDLLDRVIRESGPRYRIKNSARIAIANDFRMPQNQSESHLSIGAIIGSVSGGNVQAIGNVLNSNISQVVNDPKLLQPYLEEIAEKLINEVKAELSTKEYARYQETIESLKQQLLEEKPAIATVKKLIQSISFLGDIEGSVGLMLRVWSLVQPFVTIIALKLSNAI